MRINKLQASNKYEELILNYLENNASDMLVDKINNGNKTLQTCFKWIYEEARKQATNNCAMIEDTVVYGWAVHYFEEDEIKVEEKKESKPKIVKPKPVKVEEKKVEPQKVEPKKPIESQMNMFDLFNMEV